MSDDYTDYSPYQQVGHAWNLLANLRAAVDDALRLQLEGILENLQDVLLSLPMDPAGFPLPLPAPRNDYPPRTAGGA